MIHDRLQCAEFHLLLGLAHRDRSRLGWLRSSPGVTRGQVDAVLEHASQSLVYVERLVRLYIQTILSSENAVGQTVELMDRITVNPDQCGGRPCVRGMRIRVIDVLDLLATGMSAEQVVEELPDLEVADVTACLRFASRRLNHAVVAA
jgi:uncharacterized protein (DUF433 family)